jgi:hypothetical protein
MAFGASTMMSPVSATWCFAVVAQPATVRRAASSVGCQNDFITLPRDEA